MEKLWKQAVIVLKDGPSLIAADDILTVAVLKAMNHEDFSMDTENALFIYRHVRANPWSLKTIVRVITSRVSRTRNWAVALKGLMLMHGLFLCKTTGVESIGRLPFDLSDFGEGSSRMSRSGGFNIFVRDYFEFLDTRSTLFHDENRYWYEEESSVMIRLVIIRKTQNIVDSLIRIKPIEENMKIPLINEAMEIVISQILELYGWICRRIAQVLPNVNSKTGKTEAEMALKIVVKSISQGKELYKYFEYCRDLGISNAQEIPNFVIIPEAEVIHLNKLIQRDTDSCEQDSQERTKEEEEERKTKRALVSKLDEKDEESPAPPQVDIPDLISL